MSAPAQETTTTTEAESRDSAATTPPPPPPSILEKSVSSESGSSSPQHHVKINVLVFLPFLLVLITRNAIIPSKADCQLPSSQFSTRKDRSMSLGAYPPSWRDLEAAAIFTCHHHPRSLFTIGIAHYFHQHVCFGQYLCRQQHAVHAPFNSFPSDSCCHGSSRAFRTHANQRERTGRRTHDGR